MLAVGYAYCSSRWAGRQRAAGEPRGGGSALRPCPRRARDTRLDPRQTIAISAHAAFEFVVFSSPCGQVRDAEVGFHERLERLCVEWRVEFGEQASHETEVDSAHDL